MVVGFMLVLVVFGIACAVDPPNPDGKPPPALGSGSLAQVLEPNSAKTTDKQVAHANNSILLWCGAKQRNEDLVHLTIDKARWSKFPRDGVPLFEATEVTEFESSEIVDNSTAVLNLGQAPVTAAGKYRCDLWNSDTFLATGNLFVYMRPVFYQEENQQLNSNNESNIFELDGGDQTVTGGGNISLNCRAIAYPEVKYIWEKNGESLGEINIAHISRQLPTSFLLCILDETGLAMGLMMPCSKLQSNAYITINKEALNITDVTQEDSAIYKCIATNTFRFKDILQTFESSISFRVRVEGTDAVSAVDNQPSGGDLPPAIGFGSLAHVLEPNSAKTSDKHVAHANNSILLWCGAKRTVNDSDFLEIDKVRWSKFPNDSASLAEATVVIESVPSEVVANNTAALDLGHASVTAAGKYRCDLWNSGTFLATGNLFVYMRPVFYQEGNQQFNSKNESNIFEMDGGEKTIDKGGSVSLSCRAVGYPEIVYRWEKNGEPLKSDKHYTIYQEVLNITDVTLEDSAIFKCIATNSFRVKDVQQILESSIAFSVHVRVEMLSEMELSLRV